MWLSCACTTTCVSTLTWSRDSRVWLLLLLLLLLVIIIIIRLIPPAQSGAGTRASTMRIVFVYVNIELKIITVIYFNGEVSNDNDAALDQHSLCGSVVLVLQHVFQRYIYIYIYMYMLYIYRYSYTIYIYIYAIHIQIFIYHIYAYMYIDIVSTLTWSRDSRVHQSRAGGSSRGAPRGGPKQQP